MMITLSTDVSHDHRAGVGAYAWLAEAKGSTYRGAGLFHELIDDINAAEIYGLVSSVYAVIQELQPPSESRIVVETDSAIAIAALEGRTHRRAYYETLHDALKTKLAEHRLGIEFRYHKAHPWCDRIARALMRQRRGTV